MWFDVQGFRGVVTLLIFVIYRVHDAAFSCLLVCLATKSMSFISQLV